MRAFETYYDTIHRYETNRLHNIAQLFGHLANDAVSWAVLQAIKMNEEDMNSSRILIRTIMQEVTESMGLRSKNVSQILRSKRCAQACSR